MGQKVFLPLGWLQKKLFKQHNKNRIIVGIDHLELSSLIVSVQKILYSPNTSSLEYKVESPKKTFLND